jgi:EmrB/QacA subfamily drug resistance transporter
VIDAYSVVFASLLLAAGAIGDRYGRRRALVAGLVLFGIASAVAMTTSSADELIALRGVLGVGAALVMPATLSTITSTFPPTERTRAVGVWAAVAGGSAVVGLIMSGLLLEVWSWPSVFGLNLVLALVALAGTLRFVRESADAGAPRVDLVGAAIAIVALVALVYSVIEAPNVGWLAADTLARLAIGLAGLVAFVLVELRIEHPLLDPRIFRNRPLTAGSVSIFVQFFAFFGFTFVILQYLQLLRGDSPLLAAVSVLPLAATLMPIARLAPALVARTSARTVCASGLVLVAAGLAIISQLTASSSYALLAGGLVLLGAGMGAAMTPATAAITEALPPAQQGVGSALNDLSRELGGAIGIAVVGSVLANTYRDNLDLTGVPAPLAAHASILRRRDAPPSANRTARQDSVHQRHAGSTARRGRGSTRRRRWHRRAPRTARSRRSRAACPTVWRSMKQHVRRLCQAAFGSAAALEAGAGSWGHCRSRVARTSASTTSGSSCDPAARCSSASASPWLQARR